MIEFVDAPAPKMRSLALVVVALPVVIAAALPIADRLTSSGFVRSSPEYSWAYTIPHPVMVVPNVARTVLAPAAMSLA